MIRVDISRCSGCRRCEVACAFFHSGKVGRSIARIRVIKIEDRGIDAPVVCQQCAERYCTRCPESAITVGKFGEIIASPTLCTACGACEQLCPIGAIELVNEIPFVCDLCGGSPKCVEACTLGALTDDRAAEHVSLQAAYRATRKLGTEARRVRYAEEAAAPLRETWLAIHPQPGISLPSPADGRRAGDEGPSSSGRRP